MFSKMKNELKQKVETLYNNVVLHWKTPPLGKYVSYKEILSYSIGGMGSQFVYVFAAKIVLSASSFLVGNTIGIKPMDIQLLSIISSFLGFAITVIRSYLIDNAKFKSGKFRPWIVIMGIPTVVISTAFVFLPFETMSYLQKLISLFVAFNLLQCCQPFYDQAYKDLVNVISPNSHERTDIVSISSILYSFAPTITGALVPLLSNYTGGLNSIETYRYIFPAFAIIGFFLAYFAVFGTKERIVEAKTHVSHLKFTDMVRSVAKNKYFWIISLAGWIGFLESAIDVILGWTFIYAYPDRMGTYAIATTLIGNATLWAMMLCPFLIRKIGKRNLLIWCNIANIFLISALYPLYQNLTMMNSYILY